MAMKQSLFSDDETNNWGELFECEEDIISQRSLCKNEFINENKLNPQECWICTDCDSVNNVRDCIIRHGSRCIGCKEKCYIKSQTETIMRSQWHQTNEFYLLNIDELWQCNSCLNINQKSESHCNKCNNPSLLEIMRCDIKKFTRDQKADRLIYGFIRINQYYLQFNNIPLVLCKVIKQYYVINHNEINWTFGNITCMSLKEISGLKIDDKLDYRRKLDGKFIPVKVTNINQDAKRISLKQIEQIDNNNKRKARTRFMCHNYHQNLDKFAEYKSVTSRPAHRLKNITIGDIVDINPAHTGWKQGTVKRLAHESGQIQVKIMNLEPEAIISRFYWIHVDNEEEIAEYNSMIMYTNKTMHHLLKNEFIKQQNNNKDLANEWN